MRKIAKKDQERRYMRNHSSALGEQVHRGELRGFPGDDNLIRPGIIQLWQTERALLGEQQERAAATDWVI